MTDDTAAVVPGDGLARWLSELPRVAAASPATALTLATASLAQATPRLGPRVRAQIALRLAELEACERCVERREEEARNAGLAADAIRLARSGRAIDAREQALLALAGKLARQRGHHVRFAVDAARAGGIDDGALAEVAALVAAQVLLGYLGELAPAGDDDGHGRPER